MNPNNFVVKIVKSLIKKTHSVIIFKIIEISN